MFYQLILFLDRLILIVEAVIGTFPVLSAHKTEKVILVKVYSALVGVGVLVIIEKLTAFAICNFLFSGYAHLIITKSGIPLLGVIPQDKRIPLEQEKGSLPFSKTTGFARPYEIAFANIANRIMGKKVPLPRGFP